ncbi:hypothetical protein [Schumannella soli]|uniref:Uncharacterized protein n=1 Tax=Schumannella soli TaxID=2590779 RepID=A0A506YC96_9MICO|nr:hypothetical protein [Schumannella soli]TPW78059.1 hypothetical protein FJ657_05380 [Schumannella soli]
MLDPIPDGIIGENALTFITGAVTQNAIHVADNLEIFRWLMATELQRPYKQVRQYTQSDQNARDLVAALGVDDEVRAAMIGALDDAKAAHEKRNRLSHDVWLWNADGYAYRYEPVDKPTVGESKVAIATFIQLAADLVAASRQLVACAFLTPPIYDSSPDRRLELIAAAGGTFHPAANAEEARWFNPWRR